MTTIERYILESIQKGNNKTYLIHTDTELEPQFINKVLDSLIQKEYIQKQQESFSIIKRREVINKPAQKVLEFSLIIKNCIKNSFKTKGSREFKMKKVYLSSADEKVYQSMIYNLESFLDQANTKDGQTAKEKIVYWGEKTYQNIVSELYHSHSIA